MEGYFIDWVSFRKVSIIKSCKRAKTNRSNHSLSGEMDPKKSSFKAVQFVDKKGSELHQKGNRLRRNLRSIRRYHTMNDQITDY